MCCSLSRCEFGRLQMHDSKPLTKCYPTTLFFHVNHCNLMLIKNEKSEIDGILNGTLKYFTIFCNQSICKN